jgi:sulfane dehydrogenase subunit SoxC
VSDDDSASPGGLLALLTPLLPRPVRGAAHDEPARAPWMARPGEPMRPYGAPSAHETPVQRSVMPEFGALAPGAGVSFTPLESLRGMLTPSGLHFERHHSGVPNIEPGAYRLLVHGEVTNARIYSDASLGRLPHRSEVSFLECSGNSFWNAIEDLGERSCGELHGLFSCSEWTGVPLERILDEVRPTPEAKWLIAEGGDAAAMVRSIPLDIARRRGLIARFQNGERLRPEQGYPVRLFLRGLEGNVSVKWLRRLKLSREPVHARDETSKYSDMLADGTVQQWTLEMGVKSLITSPSPGMRLPERGVYSIEGLAWSGAGPVSRVEVSADGGKRWRNASLDAAAAPYAPVPFRISWHWRGGEQSLVSRATDATGAVQPTHAAWKARYAPGHIYHYNAVQHWSVEPSGVVRGELR